MKNYLKHIDDFFREKLGRYTETPPSDVWESLEGRLDTLVPQGPQMPNAYRWLKHLGMISLIAVLVVPLLKKINGNSAIAHVQANEEVSNQVTAGVTNESRAGTKNEQITAPDNNVPEEQQTIPTATGEADNADNKTGINDEPEHTGAKHGVSHSAATVARQQNNSRNNTRNKIANHSNAIAAVYKQPAQKSINSQRGNLALPGLEEETEEATDAPSQSNNLFATSKTGQTEIAEEKKNETELANNEKKKAEEKANKMQQSKPGKFEAGVKIGYERGMSDFAATKYVIAPYLQYKLSGKFSLMAQPAVKFAAVNMHTIGSPRSYYKANDDGTITQNGTTQKGYIMAGGSIADSSFTTNYTYKRSHDSIVKSYVHGGSYTEFELPILLKYAVLPKLAVYGGVNINYSKQISITEKTYTKAGIMQSVDSTNTSFGAPSPLAVNDVIKNTGSTYSDHEAPVYTNTQTSSLRLGYMVGFSYAYREKWMVDVLMQQTPVKPYLQGGYDVNKTLSAPYFRLSVGYKLTK